MEELDYVLRSDGIKSFLLLLAVIFVMTDLIRNRKKKKASVRNAYEDDEGKVIAPYEMRYTGPKTFSMIFAGLLAAVLLLYTGSGFIKAAQDRIKKDFITESGVLLSVSGRAEGRKLEFSDGDRIFACIVPEKYFEDCGFAEDCRYEITAGRRSSVLVESEKLS